jgi:hypothetical protein
MHIMCLFSVYISEATVHLLYIPETDKNPTIEENRIKIVLKSPTLQKIKNICIGQQWYVIAFDLYLNTIKKNDIF